MAGPYREAVATEVLQASTRDGVVKLEVAPRHVQVHVGEHATLSVTEHYGTLTHLTRKHKVHKKRALTLRDARLLVARDVPTDDVGIWHETTPGVTMRLLGLRKHGLESDRDLEDDRRQFDRLLDHLTRALAGHGRGVERALEVGAGADRVLIMDFGDRMRFHVRRLFREHPRTAFEVAHDGAVTVLQPAIFHAPGSGRLRGRRWRRARESPSFRCTFRFGVTTSGDYIRFANERGDDLGRLSLPWLRPEDRVHLADIIATRITRDDR